MPTLKLAFGAWLLPLPLALILVSLGLLLRAAARPRVGRALIIAGATLAVAATLGPVADTLLQPLETRYPAVLDAAALRPAPQYVAVLGSGYRPRAGLPVTAALDAVAVVRLTEGVRLLRQLPAAQLIVSGGPMHGEPPIARGYALAAVALGVSAAAVLMSDTPHDTGEEIRALRAQVGDAAVLLVTSAAHMPRAMALSRREGLHAVAAPTGNLARARGPGDFWLSLPSGASLRKSETALHEYEGLLALELGIE
ncbi:MAG TPA: ElyC/SanA/YdcF family protein [Steroidobacteraceae bacterium]|jgi:uncharacterized SAM-binding protein YcdF (DUF218 family)|nr:ElyC/SanA/YdcF family protein [Steroidobacteraceae bacterium]